MIKSLVSGAKLAFLSTLFLKAFDLLLQIKFQPFLFCNTLQPQPAVSMMTVSPTEETAVGPPVLCKLKVMFNQSYLK